MTSGWLKNILFLSVQVSIMPTIGYISFWWVDIGKKVLWLKYIGCSLLLLVPLYTPQLLRFPDVYTRPGITLVNLFYLSLCMLSSSKKSGSHNIIAGKLLYVMINISNLLNAPTLFLWNTNTNTNSVFFYIAFLERVYQKLTN
jgi:multisubunit Na+/H+ antiporter MnhG subunit